MTSLDPINTIGSEIAEVIIKHQGKQLKKPEMALDYMEKLEFRCWTLFQFDRIHFNIQVGCVNGSLLHIALACRPDIPQSVTNQQQPLM